MKPGATLVENASIAKLKKRYCVLQFQKATLEDQQMLLMHEMERIKCTPQ